MKKILAMALCLVMMMAMAVPAFAATTLTGQMGYECVITDEGHECTYDETTGDMTCEGAIKTGLTHSVIDSSSDLTLDTDYTIDVTGKLDSNNDGTPDDEQTPVTPADPTIAVDIYWTDMVFCYSQSWDDVNLTYVWNWTNGEDYIQVDNRSSVGVNASVTFTGDNGFADTAVEFEFDSENAVAATWENNTLTLGYGNQATAEELEADPEAVVTPSGTLNVEVADATTMATDGTATEVTLGYITVNISAVEEVVEIVYPYDELITITDAHYSEYSEVYPIDTKAAPGKTYKITWEPIEGKTFSSVEIGTWINTSWGDGTVLPIEEGMTVKTTTDSLYVTFDETLVTHWFSFSAHVNCVDGESAGEMWFSFTVETDPVTELTMSYENDNGGSKIFYVPGDTDLTLSIEGGPEFEIDVEVLYNGDDLLEAGVATYENGVLNVSYIGALDIKCNVTATGANGETFTCTLTLIQVSE